MTEKKPKTRSGARQRGPRERDLPPEQAETIASAPPAVPWREQAAFHVTLDQQPDGASQLAWRTHAYHEESGDERVQPGVLDREIVDWIRERAGLPAGDLEAETPVAAAPAPIEAAGAELCLTVGDLDVSEVPAEQQIGGEPIGVRLRTRVSFELSGPAAFVAAADLAPYAIQLAAIERDTGMATTLACARHELSPASLSYAETVEFALPQLGSYQIVANVVLLDDAAAGAALGPVLNIVP